MAHSTAAATTAIKEVNYFYQDANGNINKVLKQAEIKTEPAIGSSTIYTTTGVKNSNMGGFNQMNSSTPLPFAFVDTTHTIFTPQNSNINNIQQQHQQQAVHAIKYETPDSPVVKNEGGNYIKYKNDGGAYIKYTPNSNTKMKSKIHTTNSTQASVQKKRKPEKAGKGLRHFSMKVCEKVKEKGVTTYNEVADELVAEEIQNNSIDSANCDQKNIRRRVYDALNVLMAIQIISKDKKEIRWIGLPSNSVEQCSILEKGNEQRRERISQKHQQLRELLLQQVFFKSLIERNKEAERTGNIPTPNSSIQLPFIIVNTHKSTKINCSVTNDKSEYIFKFDDKFEMHDDAEVLKRMGLLFGLDKGQCSYDDIERAKTLVPPNFEKYIEAYGNGKGVPCDSDDESPSYIELTATTTTDSQDFVRNTGGGIKSPDLDDDDEYLDNSDID